MFSPQIRPMKRARTVFLALSVVLSDTASGEPAPGLVLAVRYGEVSDDALAARFISRATGVYFSRERLRERDGPCDAESTMEIVP